MSKPPRLVITPGEPAGIGPDIVIKMAQRDFPAELIVVADANLLLSRAKLLDLSLHFLPCDFDAPAEYHQPGTLKLLPVALREKCRPGESNPANAEYILQSLEIATDACLSSQAQALVTGPVNKALMQSAKKDFMGHTEFLAQRCKVSQVIMLFVTENMKVALATTHLPLSEVPGAITREKLINLLRLFSQELKKRFHIADPKILVCGLNPHAGENGHLGREEIDIIEPALQALRAEKIHVLGPLPADTLFTKKNLAAGDAVLAMYHDQALPVVKFAGFGNAVNVTLGLPIIRTSVDHGTALDIAGTGKADEESLVSAVQMAMDLVRS